MLHQSKNDQSVQSKNTRRLDSDNCGDNCEFRGLMYAHGHKICFPDMNVMECRNGGWIKVDDC